MMISRKVLYRIANIPREVIILLCRLGIVRATKGKVDMNELREALSDERLMKTINSLLSRATPTAWRKRTARQLYYSFRLELAKRDGLISIPELTQLLKVSRQRAHVIVKNRCTIRKIAGRVFVVPDEKFQALLNERGINWSSRLE